MDLGKHGHHGGDATIWHSIKTNLEMIKTVLIVVAAIFIDTAAISQVDLAAETALVNQTLQL